MKTRWMLATCSAVLCISFCLVVKGEPAVASTSEDTISAAAFFGSADLFRGMVLSTTFLDDAPPGCRYVHALKGADYVKGAKGARGETVTLCAGIPLVPGTDYLIAAFGINRYTPEEVQHIQDLLRQNGVTTNQLSVAADGKSFRMYGVRHLSAADDEYLVIPDGLFAVPDSCVAKTETESVVFSTSEGTERRFLHTRWGCILESNVINMAGR